MPTAPLHPPFLTAGSGLWAPGHTLSLSACDLRHHGSASSVFRSHEGHWGLAASCPGVLLISVCLSSQTLREWVAIESDSIQPVPRLRQELCTMMTLAADELRRLGASVDLVDSGSQKVLGGPLSPHNQLPLPCTSAMASLGGSKTGRALIFNKNTPIISLPNEDEKSLQAPNETVVLMAHPAWTWGWGGEWGPACFGKGPELVTPCTHASDFCHPVLPLNP